MTEPEVTVHWVGTTAVAVLPIELDLLNADATLEQLISLAGKRPGMLILDMSQSTFCDSAGAAALIHTHARAADDQIPLRLAASKNVTRSLTLLAVDRLISIYPTVDAAIGGQATSREPERLPAPERP